MLNPNTDLEQWGPLDGNVLFAGFWYKAMSGGVKRKWGVDWAEMIVTIQRGQRLTAWWDRAQLERQGIIGIKKYLLRPAKLKGLFTSYEKSRDRLLELTRKILSSPLKELDPALGEDWYKAEIDFWYDATVFETINYGSAEYLRSKLKKYVPGERLEQVLAILLVPEKMSFLKRSEVELYKVVANRGDMNKYARRWFWIDNSYLDSKHITAKGFAKRVQDLSRLEARQKINEANKYFRKVLRNKKEVAREYRLPKNILKLAGLLSWSLWLQDERKGVYWEAISGLEKLCRLASLRFKLKYEDIIVYSAEAWRDLMTKGIKIPAKTLKELKFNSVFDTGYNRYNIISGQKAESIAKKFFNRAGGAVRTQTIQGLGVSFGKVQGRVKILFSPKFTAKLKQGDILVAPFTSPDFVIAMRKAKAIITDVGGLTSHAAVVSRELGIPCVVGTKFATQILKDGNRVEVDGHSGLVRLLGSKTK